ncbi:hypothetical protein Ancab_039610 [Ancistrocladus abbreviatus]
MNLMGNPLAPVELHPDILWFDHGSVVWNITKSIQSKFDGPYTSWSSTPSTVKDCWWRFFRDQYKWNPSIAIDVLRGYERKAGTPLKDMIYKLSKVKDTAIISWYPVLVRQQLKQRRETEEFQKKSEIYSSNRTSGEYGGSLHTQGSISTSKMMRRMERYENIKNSSETQEETTTEDDQVFFQAVGGWIKKGMVYGLGSGVHLFYERSTSANYSTSKVHNLEQQVEEMKAERQQMKAQMDEQNQIILALKNAIEASGIQPCSG